MSRDGKTLEALVAFVESVLLPNGFTVDTNDKVHSDDGIPIAEFDIRVRGKVGSTAIDWLIECRDRPSTGPAPASWIEQLVGRRDRFRFNKVTAVSTTGFTSGAEQYAKESGIELREVAKLDPEEFQDWITLRHLTQRTRKSNLTSVFFQVSRTHAPSLVQRATAVLAGLTGETPILRVRNEPDRVSAAQAFHAAVDSATTIFEDLVPGAPPVRVHLNVDYRPGEQYYLEVESEEVDIERIVYTGELEVVDTLVPINFTGKYSSVDGSAISDVVTFAPKALNGMTVAIEMHRVADTGETHVVMRRLQDDA